MRTSRLFKDQVKTVSTCRILAACILIMLMTLGFVPIQRNYFSVRAERTKLNSTNLSRASGKLFSRMLPPQEHVDTPHSLAASYYSVERGFDATLMLSNQGPHNMDIRVTLFAPSGVQFLAPPITLEGNTVGGFNIDKWVSAAGVDFREGSIQVNYEGKDMELGGLINLVNLRRSLIFDEELTEPAKMFASSRLEGVWWLPSSRTKLRLALSNTNDTSVSATLKVDGIEPGQKVEKELNLQPRETRLLDVQDLNAKAVGTLRQIGGISIQHSGSPGALLAHGFIENASTGYSSVIDFSDPGTVKSSKLDGAGLRIGPVAGERLTQIAVARNIGEKPTTLTGQIRYVAANGHAAAILIAPIQIEAGDIRSIDLAKLVRQAHLRNTTAAGLEFVYSGSPGSVVMSAQSVSSSRTHSFRVPLVDVAAQHSSTGKYPWSIDANSSTIVYLKNATDHQQQYTFQINFPGGSYTLGLRSLEADSVETFDLRKLRDDQVPDVHGNVIPLTASNGQLIWSVHGSENRVLLGRAEQVDITHGISMTAACPTCCPNSFQYGYMDPDGAVGLVGDFSLFRAWEVDFDCYTNSMVSFNPSAFFESTNTAVATCDSNGGATAVGIGNANINASWFAPSWFQIYEECQYSPVDAFISALCDVLAQDVIYKKVTFSNTNANFDAFNRATLNIGGAAGGTGACSYGASNEFMIVIDFKMPVGANAIKHPDSRTFVSDSSNQQFQYTSFGFQNVDFSTENGQMWIRLFRTHRGPKDSVSVNITGTYQDQVGVWSGGGTVHLVCP